MNENKYKNWAVDCNQFEPMKHTSIIVRNYTDGDNGVGDKLMIVGFNEINPDLDTEGLTIEDAVLIASAPKMQYTIAEVLSLLKNDKYSLELIKDKLFNALIRSGYEMD